MNMRLPGFSAESALVKAKGVYRGLTARAAPQGVTPAGNFDPAFCEGKGWGNYPHPTLCTHFIRCADDGTWEISCQSCHVHPVTCPEGLLHYDTASDSCGWAEESDCSA